MNQRILWAWIAIWCSLFALHQPANAQSITHIQYYYNTDPGVGVTGNGGIISISPGDSIFHTFSVPLSSSLTNGIHQLYVRVRNQAGQWSIPERKSFLILKPDTAVARQIIAYQYFFDTDPGFDNPGNGAIVPVTPGDEWSSQLAVPVPAGLADGIHQLFVRVKDSRGSWSIAESRLFMIFTPDTSINQIVKYQYYFNQDPGLGIAGNGAVVQVNPADTVQLVLSIALPAGLAPGAHHLYFRTMGINGSWSVAERRLLYVKDIESKQITAMEYYIDNDPGPGNANPYPITPADSLQLTAAISVPCLSEGVHYLYWRARNAEGVWSIIARDTFEVDSGVAAPIITPGGPVSLCAGDSIILQINPVDGAGYQWLVDGADIQGATSTQLSVHAAGNYAVKIICGNSFSTSAIVTVNIAQVLTWYADADGDGFGNPQIFVQNCAQPAGYVSNSMDCNDADPAIYPGAHEVCNGVDDDCNGLIDDGVFSVFYADADADGFGNPSRDTLACAQPAGFVSNNQDCDDANPDVNPNATEICNGIDDNCNQQVDEGVSQIFYADADGDGYGNPNSSVSACSMPSGYVTNNLDCNDGNALEFPGQLWYIDRDSDGYSNGDTIRQCTRPIFGFATQELSSLSFDCNDTNALIHPGRPEVCNGLDDDCDGLIDDADPGLTNPSTWYADLDGDGYGDPAAPITSCTQPAQYVSNNQDCNDSNPFEFPGQVWYRDADQDGYGTGVFLIQCSRPSQYSLLTELTSTQGDCDDNNPNINPGAQYFSYAGTVNFEDAIAHPLQGSPISSFSFMVDYFDATNSLPPVTYPRLILDYEGNGTFTDLNDRSVIMIPLDAGDLNTADGKRYVANVSSLPSGANWKVSVQGSPSACQTQFGPFDYPDVMIQPDLQIYADDIWFSANNPPVNSALTVYARISNVSDYHADTFRVAMVNQYDFNIVYDTLVVTNLSPKSSTIVQWNITTPLDSAWCPMQVWIDVDNRIAESNEINNSAVRPFINGNFDLSGGIQVSALQSNPAVSYAAYGAKVWLSGKAIYFGTPLPLADPSVAGASVTFVIPATGAVYAATTNAQGYFNAAINAPMSPGTYQVQGTITDFTFSETFEMGFTILPPQACLPDLVAAAFTPTSTVVAGNSMTMNIYVSNVGCSASGASVASTSSSAGASFTNSFNIPALATGQSHTINRTLTFNTPGLYSYCATADATHVVTESSEYNNTSCITITVLPALPDLVPALGPAGQAFLCESGGDLGFHIRNQGGAASGSFTAEVVCRLNGNVYNTVQQTITNIPSQGQTAIYLPGLISAPGIYTFELRCDVPVATGGDVTEYIESNNVTTFTLEVLECKPNLVFKSCEALDVDPSDPAHPGGTMNFIAKLSNDGKAAAVSPVVRFMLSDSSYYDVQYNGTVGVMQTVNVVSPAIPSVAPATMMLTAIADPAGLIDELDEQDNIIQDSLCIDLMIVKLPATCGGVSTVQNFIVNKPVEISAGLTAGGLYNASSVTVRFEVSGPSYTGKVHLADIAVDDVRQSCGCPRKVSLPFTFIFPQVGTYTFTITADPGQQFTECNESNNVYEMVVNVTTLPDMRVFSQYINPSRLNPSPGEQVTMAITYDNAGLSNPQDQMKLKVLVNEVAHDSVYPVYGQAYGDDTTVSIPTPWVAPAIPGTYIIRAMIDSDNQVTESDELNNEATRAIIVGDAANLYFQLFEPSNPVPAASSNIQLHARIGNSGALSSQADVRFYYTDNNQVLQPIGVVPVLVNGHDSVSITLPWLVNDPITTLVARIENSNPEEYNYEDNEARYELGMMQLQLVTTPACRQDSSGSITTNITGGNPPYYYQWSNLAQTSSINGAPGIYSVTVTDLDGRIAVATAEIANDTGMIWYRDADEDGYGDPLQYVITCTQPQGYVDDPYDCDDTNPLIYPGSTEICGNGLDDDCDGLIDETGCTGCFNGLYYTASITGDSILCEGETVVLQAAVSPTGSYTYLWLPNATTDTTLVLTPTAGIHTVTLIVSSQDGCHDTVQMQVTVHPKPVLSILGNNSLILGETGQLTATSSGTGPFSYLWSPGNGTDSVLSISPTQATTFTVSVTDQSTGCTQADSIHVTVLKPADLRLKVFLQGALQGQQTMSRTLNTAGLLPQSQPYNTAPWHHNGTESLSSIPQEMTDWVLVELRSDPTSVVARRAAVLRSDGTLADTSGNANIRFYVPGDQYHVVIHHRNHLPVMTAQAVSVNDTLVYDFSDTLQYPVYGRSVILTSHNTPAMIAGDINHDDFLRYSGAGNDRSLILQRITGISGSSSINTTVQGYYREDLNMNGVVRYSGQGNDASLIILNITNLTGNTTINSVFKGPVTTAP